MVMVNGHILERIKRIYINDEYNVFLFTGQRFMTDQPQIQFADSDKTLSGLKIPDYLLKPKFQVEGAHVALNAFTIAIPFNAMSADHKSACAAIALPYDTDSRIDLTFNKAANRLEVYDPLTDQRTILYAQMLDRSVQRKLTTPKQIQPIIV
jgi:hypothetical protein